MKLAIMQPYFFPYVGYFDLIRCVDQFLVFDTAQYVRRGWCNRNRLLHPTQGWQYFTVPIKKHVRATPIVNIEIDSSVDWATKIKRQFDHYRYHNAPHFKDVLGILNEELDTNQTSLSRLNLDCLKAICRYLGLRFEYRLMSELEFGLHEGESAEDYVVRICASMGGKKYVNLPGGVGLYSPEVFKRKGVELSFRNIPVMKYVTPGYQFEPGLSILDVLMWNSPGAVMEFLDSCEMSASSWAS